MSVTATRKAIFESILLSLLTYDTRGTHSSQRLKGKGKGTPRLAWTMLPQQQPRYQQSALFAHNPYVGNFQLWQKQDKLSCETMRNARDAMKSNPYIGYVHHGGRGIGDLLWEEEKTKPVVTHVEIAKKERWKARHLTRTMLQMLPWCI